MRGVAIVLAAGEGSRLGTADPKAFVDVAGRSMLQRSVHAACSARSVDRVVIVVPDGWESKAEAAVERESKPCIVVTGGATRQASAAAGFAKIGDVPAVLIHDAARPLAKPELFQACLDALDDAEVVCPVIGVSDTIKEVVDGIVNTTPDRSQLFAAQTPQGFRAEIYARALAAASADGVEATDDVAIAERIGVPVQTILGDMTNIKVTVPYDLLVAEAILR